MNISTNCIDAADGVLRISATPAVARPAHRAAVVGPAIGTGGRGDNTRYASNSVLRDPVPTAGFRQVAYAGGIGSFTVACVDIVDIHVKTS